MKKILLSLSLFFVNFVNSQVIKIEVSGVMDAYGYDTSVLKIMNNDSLTYEYRKVNSFYDLDLTNKKFVLIRKNGDEINGDIDFIIKDGIYLIYFLVDGYNSGLIVNTDLNNEQVTWFSISEELFSDSHILQTYIEISKFISTIWQNLILILRDPKITRIFNQTTNLNWKS
jgi:hypothetical protein